MYISTKITHTQHTHTTRTHTEKTVIQLYPCLKARTRVLLWCSNRYGEKLSVFFITFFFIFFRWKMWFNDLAKPGRRVCAANVFWIFNVFLLRSSRRIVARCLYCRCLRRCCCHEVLLSVRRVRARADSRPIGCPQEALITQQRPNQRRKERDQRVVKLMTCAFYIAAVRSRKRRETI